MDKELQAFENDIVLKDSESVVREFKDYRTKLNPLFKILQANYKHIFIIDVKTRLCMQLCPDDGTKEIVPLNYELALENFLLKYVLDEDKERIKNTCSFETVLEKIKAQGEFETSYLSDKNGIIQSWHAKFWAVNDSIDEKKNELEKLILTFEDTGNEEELRRRIIAQNMKSIKNLFDNYECIVYLDPESGQYEIHEVDIEFDDKVLSHIKIGSNFYEDVIDAKNSVFCKEDIPAVKEFFKKENLSFGLAVKGSLSLNFRFIIDGKRVWYRNRVIKSYTFDGKVSYIIGVQNIAEEMKDSIEKQRNFEIIEALALEYESVYYIDFDTNEMNPIRRDKFISAKFPNYDISMLGYNIAVSYYLNDIVYKEDKNEFLEVCSSENILKNLKANGVYKKVFRACINDQIVYMEAKVVKSSEGKNCVILGIANKDKEIRAEQEYNRQLEESRINAEKANRAKTNFLLNMSHDIRTPMNAILGFTDIARKNVNNEERVEDCIEKIQLSGSHLLSLINNILDMSRIESGATVIEPVPINGEEKMSEITTIINQSAKNKGVTFTYNINIRDKNIYADMIYMQQILINILGNAVKYTPAGGKVHLNIEQIESIKTGYATYHFVVKDNGVGMSEEFLSRIYEEFSRERNSTTSGIQGTGLGMSITKKLVELMGGTIDIKSKQNEGTTVDVVLSFKILEKELQTNITETENINVNLENNRVLLVEDNELNREIAVDILETEKMKVDQAIDGKEAVEKFISSPEGFYDFILMDIQMPVMNGHDATRTIRASSHPDAKSIPIIAMTANVFEEDKKASYDAGMNAHIAKPIRINSLINVLKSFVK